MTKRKKPVPSFGSYKRPAQSEPVTENAPLKSTDTKKHKRVRRSHGHSSFQLEPQNNSVPIFESDPFFIDTTGDISILKKAYIGERPSNRGHLSRNKGDKGDSNKGLLSLSNKRADQIEPAALVNYQGFPDSDLDGVNNLVHVDNDESKEILSDEDPFVETEKGTENHSVASHNIQVEKEILVRNQELWHAIKEDPRSVGAWLALIEHQDLLLRDPEESSKPLTPAARKTLASNRISLYEDAILKVGDSPRKDILILGLLQEGVFVWDRAKLLEQWQSMLTNNSQLISLWIKYIDFRHTDSQSFTFIDCLMLYHECLQMNASVTTGDQKWVNLCYIFLRMTLFLREAGYVEYAVGFWQAVIEFSCFAPAEFSDHVTGDKTRAISSFREFWNSESSRVGDAGAAGWRSTTFAQVASITQNTSKINLSDPLHSWVEAERDSISKNQMPSRAFDVIDPSSNAAFHTLLADDVVEILEFFWGMNSPDTLIDAFHHFCHLPPLSPTLGWTEDNFTYNEFVDNYRLGISAWMLSKDSTSASPPVSPISNFIITTDTLFPSKNWFSFFQPWREADSSAWVDRYAWIRRFLRALLERFSSNDILAEHTLAFESVCSPGKAKTLAKKVLSRRQSSLRIWNAYALMLSQDGEHEAAKSTRISICEHMKQSGDAAISEWALFWHSWIWSSIAQKELKQAIYLINRLYKVISGTSDSYWDVTEISDSDEESMSAIAFKILENRIHTLQLEAMGNSDWQSFVIYTDCLAISSYFTGAETLNVYKKAASELELHCNTDLGHVKELLHQSRSKLVFYFTKNPSEPHGLLMSHTKFSPMEFRNLLKESLVLFPHNTIFLSLMLQNEARIPFRERIFDPWAVVSSHDNNSSISTALFAISVNLARSPPHRTRKLFEKVLEEHPKLGKSSNAKSDKTRKHANHSPRLCLTVWKLYTLFEVYVAKDLKAAKGVFYRAISACPWSKELVMLGFEHLRDDLPNLESGRAKEKGLSLEDSRKIYALLHDRQLRVHVDIRNFMDSDEDIADTSSGEM